MVEADLYLSWISLGSPFDLSKIQVFYEACGWPKRSLATVGQNGHLRPPTRFNKNLEFQFTETAVEKTLGLNVYPEPGMSRHATVHALRGEHQV